MIYISDSQCGPDGPSVVHITFLLVHREFVGMINCNHFTNSNKIIHTLKNTKLCLIALMSNSSLLVARQGDVSRKFNQAFLLVDSFNFYFVDEERSDIYVHYI